MNERANKEDFLTFSPKDFISGPYIECPKCHNNTFGILGIHDTKYSRRCSHCFFPTYQRNEHWDCYKLPALNKKIIYLDQFCISNMAKFLTPNIRNQKGIASFWGVLFSKLDSLCKLQLIICPESCIHKNESLLSRHFSSLKRIYQHFSHNVSFYDFETIRRFQISVQLRKWLGEKNVQEVDVHRIINGNINAWQEKHLLTVNVQDPDSLILELQTTREKVDLSFETVCKRWQTEKGKKFEYWFGQEIKGYASGLCELYMKQIKDYFLMSMGLSPFNLNSAFPNEAVIQQLSNVVAWNFNPANF